MRLESVSAEIRPRSAWEAIDLGMALVRRDYGFIMLAWAATVLPFCLLCALLLKAWPALWVLAIFWFKPLFDRVPLFIISRSLFGTRPTMREILKSPKFFTRLLFGDLTWRRFSLSRSYLMPVSLLEGLSGKPRATRVQVLNRESDAQNTSLMTVCAFFETAMALAIVGIVYMLNPSPTVGAEIQDWVSGFDAEQFLPIPNIVSYGFAAAYFLAMSLVEPFYVGAGFGMYVNGRTRSEGWDLELKFRQLESRLVTRASKVTLGLLLGSILIGTTTNSLGQDSVPDLETDLTTEVDDSSPGGIAQEILDQPEFTVHSRTESSWNWKGANQGSDNGLPFFQLFGRVFFWFVIAAAIAGLAYWIYTYRHVFLGLSLKKPDLSSKQPRTTSIMGMDVRAESLPDNITQVAWDAWTAGRRQEALSLLYRGSISWMVEREHLPIVESDTEMDCLERAESLTDRKTVDYFKNLTNRWTGAAYGKLWPDDATVKDLCQNWPFHRKEASS